MNNVMNKVVSFIILAISYTMCAHGIDWSNIDKENVDNARYVILRTDGKPGLHEQLTRDETIELLEIIRLGSHNNKPIRGRINYRVKSVFEITTKSGEILSFCPNESLFYRSKSRFVLPLSQKEPLEKLIKKILRRVKYQF